LLRDVDVIGDFRAVYVEEKRQLYAPGTKAPESNPSAIPKNPYAKSSKPFNAWAEHLIGEHGFPSIPSATAARSNNDSDDKKKRKAEDDDAPKEREISYDGVRYKARKSNGSVEIIDEDKIGQGESGWKMGKLIRFTISSKEDKPEAGERFNYGEFKRRLEPIAKPAFVGLSDNRQVAGLPEKKEDSEMKSEFPEKLKAPPMVVASSEVKKEEGGKLELKDGQQEYPAKGQASFKDVVTDELFEQLKKDVSEVNGRKVEWTRAPGELSNFLPCPLLLSSPVFLSLCTDVFRYACS